jgi:hypothetical protein
VSNFKSPPMAVPHLMGGGDGAPAAAALALVLLYLAVFAAAVRTGALPRDLT